MRAGGCDPALHNDWEAEEIMNSFVDLYRRLLKINFFGIAGVALPEGPVLSIHQCAGCAAVVSEDLLGGYFG
jgi:hypothetical protein